MQPFVCGMQTVPSAPVSAIILAKRSDLFLDCTPVHLSFRQLLPFLTGSVLPITVPQYLYCSAYGAKPTFKIIIREDWIISQSIFFADCGTLMICCGNLLVAELPDKKELLKSCWRFETHCSFLKMNSNEMEVMLLFVSRHWSSVQSFLPTAFTLLMMNCLFYHFRNWTIR